MKQDYYEYNGEKLTLGQLAEKSANGVTPAALRYRLKTGMDIKKAMTMPVGKRTRRKESGLPCGAKNPFDCLRCKYEEMPCLSWPTMIGEGGREYAFGDSEKKE